MENPTGGLYPNEFKVKYTFPIMYVGPGQIVRNWSYSFLFSVSEDILISDKKVDSEFFKIENGAFPDDMIPYNSHVSKTWFCIGSEWESARGLGIWYFVISIGGILNQDKSEMNIHETVHLNSAAYDYWTEDRNMQPNNNISWPFNLADEDTKKKYNVLFVDDNNTILFDQMLEEGSPITPPSVPAKPGKAFKEWVPSVPNKVGNSNLRFVASYKPIIKITPKVTVTPTPNVEKPKFTIKRK